MTTTFVGRAFCLPLQLHDHRFQTKNSLIFRFNKIQYNKNLEEMVEEILQIEVRPKKTQILMTYIAPCIQNILKTKLFFTPNNEYPQGPNLSLFLPTTATPYFEQKVVYVQTIVYHFPSITNAALNLLKFPSTNKFSPL